LKGENLLLIFFKASDNSRTERGTCTAFKIQNTEKKGKISRRSKKEIMIKSTPQFPQQRAFFYRFFRGLLISGDRCFGVVKRAPYKVESRYLERPDTREKARFMSSKW